MRFQMSMVWILFHLFRTFYTKTIETKKKPASMHTEFALFRPSYARSLDKNWNRKVTQWMVKFGDILRSSSRYRLVFNYGQLASRIAHSNKLSLHRICISIIQFSYQDDIKLQAWLSLDRCTDHHLLMIKGCHPCEWHTLLCPLRGSFP